MIACTRCLIELGVDYDALARLDVPTGFSDLETFERDEHMETSPPSGANLPLVIPAPAGCLTDPNDEDLLIHRGCATGDELAELTPLERRVAYAESEDELDA